MKTYLKTTFLFGATLLGGLFQTQAQIADSGFENWDSVEFNGFKNFMPAGWFEVTNVVCEMEGKPWSVTRTTDAYKGQFAIQMANVATSLKQPAILFSTASESGESLNNKIPVNARYTSLNAFYKYMPAAVDTFNILVLMFKGEDMIGAGEFKSSTAYQDYVGLHIPIIYMSPASVTPDSAVIMITAGSTENFVEGTILQLDEMEFGMASGIQPENDGWKVDVSMAPNPAHDFVNLELRGKRTGKTYVELYSITGGLLRRIEVEFGSESQQVYVSLAGLPKGFIFVKVMDQHGSKTLKLSNQ